MNIYPALRSQMGLWDYYVVKMSARELSENVKYVSEVYNDTSLDEAVQRTLDEEIQRALSGLRVKKDIVDYLKRQPYRFFSSIVVAALEGEPMFYPIEITADPQFAIFRDDRRLNESFGVLKFDGTQTYYALDGQHRLAAIKTLLDRSDPLSVGTPEDFENDEFSVIVIVPSQTESHETFMQKYRRLFTNLNRYAKATDQATNIIMDEDDTFAIITRRLITENDFFKSEKGHQLESTRIKAKKGKNLTHRDSYFTSIETLYEMNIELLSSAQRRLKGWGPNLAEGEDLKYFKRFRPPEEYIDSLYDELTMYWEALLKEIRQLRSNPIKMRVHELADENADAENETDHLLFWPIGQQMLAEIARELLDKRLPDPAPPTPDTVGAALKGLGKLEWRLHKAPWRYFLLIGNASGRWAMRNEERKKAVRCGRLIQQWVLGLENLDAKGVERLKGQWANFLTPSQTEEERDRMWEEVVELKTTISG